MSEPITKDVLRCSKLRSIDELADWLVEECGFSHTWIALAAGAIGEQAPGAEREGASAPREVELFVSRLLRESVFDIHVIDPSGPQSSALPAAMAGLTTAILPASFATRAAGCEGVDCAFSAWKVAGPVMVPCSGRNLYTGERCCFNRCGEAQSVPDGCGACPLFPFAFVLVACKERVSGDDFLMLELAREKMLRLAERTRAELEARKAAEMDTVESKVLMRLSETLDLGKRMSMLLGTAMGLLAADSGSVLLYDRETLGLEPLVSRNADFCDTGRGPFMELLEEVARSRRPLLLANHGREPLVEAGFSVESSVALPLNSKGAVIGVLFLASKSSSRRFCRADLVLMEGLAMLATMGIENSFLYESMEEKERLHRKLLGMIINAQEDERKRIAGDIHDDTIQALISSFYRLEGVELLIEDGRMEEATEELTRTKASLQRNIGGMRRLLFDLRPSILDDAGLVPALENYLSRMEEETGIRAVFYVEEGLDRLTPDVEITVYRLAQELLMNVRKHARASEVKVGVLRRGELIEMTIGDNGIGFDIERALNTETGYEEHLGLKSVIERTEIAGGETKIRATPGKGTEVTIRVPDRM